GLLPPDIARDRVPALGRARQVGMGDFPDPRYIRTHIGEASPQCQEQARRGQPHAGGRRCDSPWICRLTYAIAEWRERGTLNRGRRDLGRTVMLYALTTRELLQRPALWTAVHRLRHEVFVEELGWKDLARPDRLEIDQ